MVVVVMVIPRPPAIAARIREVAERVASKRVRRSVTVDPETVFVRAKSLDERRKSTSGA